MLTNLGGANWTLILGVLFAMSEAIGMIPGIKASGVFQAVYNTLKSLKDLFTPKPPAA